ncbi:MAG: META domain-containing protein [Sphingopyxis sp.]
MTIASITNASLRPALATALAAALLSGCAATTPQPAATTPPASADSGTSSGAAPARDDAYFAMGNEPFWSVEITADRINFIDGARRRIMVDNPGARPSFNGERYTTPRITVDITHSLCTDGMSGRRYQDRVMVQAGTRNFNGCGGDAAPPETLDNTQWRIISLNGQAVDAAHPAELAFADGRVFGTAGCNRLSGTFTCDGRQLTVSRMASTMMACTPVLMQQEAVLTGLLNGPSTIRIDARGRMTLTGANNATTVLEPAP